MDVPVITQLEFQQFVSYENLEVPQIQLIVEVVDIPIVLQRQVPTCPLLYNDRCVQLQFVDKVVKSLSWRRGRSPWFRLSADHRDFAVAIH